MVSNLIWTVVITFELCLGIPIDDPSAWPGHLESFGSKQKTIDIEVHYKWPSPKDFFKQFVDKSKPVLFRGVYKHSRAFHLWNDKYFTEHNLSSKVNVKVEKNLKETRSGDIKIMTFKEFIKSYQKQPILMFDTIPNHFMRDLVMPPPLSCRETNRHFINAIGVISRGGSKSVVCNEDVETIFCPIQGTVDTLLIEYTQNKNYVIDKPEGGYSSLDVEKVDYVKYPELRKVDQYVRATLTEGDCLYIPYRWYKQMNSHASSMGCNIALNLWFKHLHHHEPSNCVSSEEDSTLDKFQYSDVLEDNSEFTSDRHVNSSKGAAGDPQNTDEDSNDMELFKHFVTYLKKFKHKNITFEEFYEILKKDEVLTKQNHQNLIFPSTFRILAVELYKRLDVTNDTLLSVKDFSKILHNKTRLIKMSAYLEYQTARIEDYVEDLVEAGYHDEPLHKFEERMKIKFRSERNFDEL